MTDNDFSLDDFRALSAPQYTIGVTDEGKRIKVELTETSREGQQRLYVRLLPAQAVELADALYYFAKGKT